MSLIEFVNLKPKAMKTSGKILCEAFIGKPQNQKFNGAKKLRDIVEWMNNRKESLNENKSHLELIAEYNNQKS